jgi:hypothetical protein
MIRIFSVASLITVLSACGSSSSSPSPTSSSPTPTTSAPSTRTFQGTFGGNGGETGRLNVTIPPIVTSSIGPLAVSQIAGSVHVAGGSMTGLTGTYDSSANAVHLSGGEFTFTGAINGVVLAGTYTSLNNSGGAFSILNDADATITTFCGTYSYPPSGEGGIYNLQVSTDGTVSGDGISTSVVHGGFLFTGRLSGTNLEVTTFDIETGRAIGVDSITLGVGTFTGVCDDLPRPASSPASSQCTLAGNTSLCQ